MYIFTLRRYHFVQQLSVDNVLAVLYAFGEMPASGKCNNNQFRLFDGNDSVIQILVFHQAKCVAKALHMQSNYHDKHAQRLIRIFSLQIKQQPIQIKMKQLFTFNYTLLKSVSGSEPQNNFQHFPRIIHNFRFFRQLY